jgi:hypothetical protein
MGDDPRLEIVNGHGRFTVSDNVKGVAVARDGVKLPGKSLEREGQVIRVIGETGETVLMIGRLRGHGGRRLVYSADLDPSAVSGRYGFGLTTLDARAGRQLGLDPDDVAVVSRVCPGSVAERGGLQEDDIVLRVDGTAPLTAALLEERAARKEAGSELRLTVFRAGRETEVSLTAPPVPAWPAAGELEATLRLALDDLNRR